MVEQNIYIKILLGKCEPMPEGDQEEKCPVSKVGNCISFFTIFLRCGGCYILTIASKMM
jgi:hypothetical protein